MSLRTGLAVVGGIVGAYFGNPQLGWAIGSALGAAVDPQTIPGPRLGEIQNQTAQEGGPRPIVFGISQPIPPNVIAQGDPKIVRGQQSAGKGGPNVTTESVYRTYSVGICEGPIDSVRRVWRNNVLVYDATETPQLSLEENAAFLERARFFLGGWDQMPSSDLETIFGVGATPAFRGTAHMVMADEDLTDLRGAIPQWIFQVNRGGAFTYAREVFNAAGGDQTWTPPEGVTTCDVLIVGRGGNARNTGSAGGRTASGGGGGGQVRWIEDIPVTGPVTVVVPTTASGRPPTKFGDLEAQQGAGGHISTGVTDGGSGAGGAVANTGITPPALSPIILPPGNSTVLPMQWAGGVAGVREKSGGGVPNFAAAGGGGGGAGSQGGAVIFVGNPATEIQAGYGGTGVYLGDRIGNDLGHDGWFGGGGGGGLSESSETITWHRGLGGQGGGGDGSAPDVDEFPGNAATGGMAGTGGGAGGNSGSINSTPEGGSGVVVVRYVDPDNPVPGGKLLAGRVLDICARANLPAELVDVSLLPQVPVEGLTITNQYMAVEALRALGQTYMFDFVPVDGKIRFVPRGGNSVRTITADDMVDDGEVEEDSMRDDTIVIPRVLNLSYFDIAGGLATDKQTSERAGDRRSVGEKSLQNPVLMSADRAKRVAVVTHKVMAENQRGLVKFSLHDGFLDLIPTSPIIAPVSGVNRRLRVERVDLRDGYQRYELAHDRQSAYTTNIEGIPAAPQTPPPGSLVGPTLLAVLDIPLIRDSDDLLGLGVYIAVAGSTGAWAGALLEASRDGGATFDPETVSIGAQAVIGELLDSLPAHSQYLPDYTSTLTVRLQTWNAELEATDLEGMQNRVNLAAIGNEAAGWELICFADPDEVSEGVWEIRELLRGRKGTDPRVHLAGEKFVLLDRSVITRLQAEISDLGEEVLFRATSVGLTTDSAVSETITYAGRAQIERAVHNISAQVDGAYISVEWQGVGRVGGGSVGAQHGVFFDEYAIKLTDGATTVETTSPVQSLTQHIGALDFPVEVTVTQSNALTGEGPGQSVLLVGEGIPPSASYDITFGGMPEANDSVFVRVYRFPPAGAVQTFETVIQGDVTWGPEEYASALFDEIDGYFGAAVAVGTPAPEIVRLVPISGSLGVTASVRKPYGRFTVLQEPLPIQATVQQITMIDLYQFVGNIWTESPESGAAFLVGGAAQANFTITGLTWQKQVALNSGLATYEVFTAPNNLSTNKIVSLSDLTNRFGLFTDYVDSVAIMAYGPRSVIGVTMKDGYQIGDNWTLNNTGNHPSGYKPGFREHTAGVPGFPSGAAMAVEFVTGAERNMGSPPVLMQAGDQLHLTLDANTYSHTLTSDEAAAMNVVGTLDPGQAADLNGVYDALESQIELDGIFTVEHETFSNGQHRNWRVEHLTPDTTFTYSYAYDNYGGLTVVVSSGS